MGNPFNHQYQIKTPFEFTYSKGVGFILQVYFFATGGAAFLNCFFDAADQPDHKPDGEAEEDDVDDQYRQDMQNELERPS